MIHKTALIDPSASISSNVEIGAYAIIDKNVSIDDGTVIKEHAIIRENTSIGKNNVVYQFSSIGEQPQDLKYKNEITTCTIGDNNIFRENCTIHRGTKEGIANTSIGNDNLFMAFTHVAHDCVIQDKCIFSNAASLAGHVEVDSYVSLGGFTLVHQYCRIGKYAFSGLGTVISQDVTPYTLIAGNHAKAYKINSEGLKRKNFKKEDIKLLERCFKLFVKSNIPLQDKLESFGKLNIENSHLDYFINFIVNSKRGITR
jgi:UDP-N-acetylglucosamine acyltransferase